MRIIQKISAVLLSVSLLIPALPASAASGTAVSGEDRVSLIIELEQPAVLEDTSAKSMGWHKDVFPRDIHFSPRKDFRFLRYPYDPPRWKSR